MEIKYTLDLHKTLKTMTATMSEMMVVVRTSNMLL